MARKGRRLTWLAAAVMAAAFLLWSVLRVTGALDGLDRALLPGRIAPRSVFGQILDAVSIALHPIVVFIAVLGIALWSGARRLRRLSMAIIGAVIVGWTGYELLKLLFRVARPASGFSDAITYSGYSYPSGHVVAATIASVTVVTVTTLRRRSTTFIWVTRTLGALFVLAVAADRLLMRHHWFSDLVGGALFGGTVILAALILAGLDTLAESLGLLTRPQVHVDKRAAIIYNPSKVTDFDLFRNRVEYELRERGWKPPLWLETEEDDPGHQMAKDALAKKVDLVLVAGGDGTVRVVCSELVGSDVPVALVPAGTGNLLARNLGVPLDEQKAFDVAFEGVASAIDVVRFTAGDHTEHFVVMSGMGGDAEVMADTNPELKKVVGSGAYFLAAAQKVGSTPYDITVTLDDHEPVKRSAMLAVVGNVGTLQGGIRLFPQADPRDGRLDVLIGSPNGVSDWAKVASGLLGGVDVEPLEYAQGTRVVFESPKPVPYQLDGDASGDTSRFEAEIVPGGLKVMVSEEGHPDEA
ncbi:MAG TPA: diacylglycerol kinase family protein [Propionibacteriaceae bacterium]|nr:diacylglycerol kinase family protein [Propionibacteriaceae bacterium]